MAIWPAAGTAGHAAAGRLVAGLAGRRSPFALARIGVTRFGSPTSPPPTGAREEHAGVAGQFVEDIAAEAAIEEAEIEPGPADGDAAGDGEPHRDGRDLRGRLGVLAQERGVDFGEIARGFLVINAIGAVRMLGIHVGLLGRRGGGRGCRSSGRVGRGAAGAQRRQERRRSRRRASPASFSGMRAVQREKIFHQRARVGAGDDLLVRSGSCCRRASARRASAGR